jgi:hypothetical protein
VPTASLAETKSPKLNPAVFTKHYRKIRDLKEQQDDVSSELRLAKKAAKTDGVDLDALQLMEKLAKLDDDEAELQLRHMHQYATWLKMPLGTQFGLFGTTVVPKGQEALEDDDAIDDIKDDEAGEAGKLASKRGELRSANPHPVGSRLFAAWDKGWLGHMQDALTATENREPEAEPKTDAKQRHSRKPNGRASTRGRRMAEGAPAH